MTAAVVAKLRRLPADVRDRVIERAAILIFDARMDPDAADERALFLEAGIVPQRSLPGVDR